MAYEKNLTDYETSAVKANIWNSAMPPIYKVISMTSVLFILYFWSEKYTGKRMEQLVNRNIYHVSGMLCEAFYKIIQCGKLFNAVHKAQVS